MIVVVSETRLKPNTSSCLFFGEDPIFSVKCLLRCVCKWKEHFLNTPWLFPEHSAHPHKPLLYKTSSLCGGRAHLARCSPQTDMRYDMSNAEAARGKQENMLIERCISALTDARLIRDDAWTPHLLTWTLKGALQRDHTRPQLKNTNKILNMTWCCVHFTYFIDRWQCRWGFCWRNTKLSCIWVSEMLTQLMFLTDSERAINRDGCNLVKVQIKSGFFSEIGWTSWICEVLGSSKLLRLD